MKRRRTVEGLVWAATAIALTTLLLEPLSSVAPAESLGVIYLLPVLAISILWSVWIGSLTAVISALSFNFFHIEPTGTLSVNSPDNIVALFIFLIAALTVSTVAEIARNQALEAERRRLEADIASELARILLGGEGIKQALPRASRRLAEQLGLSWARLSLTDSDPEEELGIQFEFGPGRRASLTVPPETEVQTTTWIRDRIVPGIPSVLNAAIDREEYQEEAIATKALERSDAIKTALLRSVSHDLRSPLAAILTSGDVLRSPSLSPAERTEMSDVVVTEAGRLSRLVDNLLDLSVIEAGAAQPRRDWCDLEEVIVTAIEEACLSAPEPPVKFMPPGDPALNRVDPAQVERALVNLIENARRYSGLEPVTVNLRSDPDSSIISIVDRGPGIPDRSLEQVFEPFVRLKGSDGHKGSGLGLAIAKGFVEANAGTIRAESLPGQGTAMVVEFPKGSAAGPDEPAARQPELRP